MKKYERKATPCPHCSGVILAGPGDVEAHIRNCKGKTSPKLKDALFKGDMYQRNRNRQTPCGRCKRTFVRLHHQSWLCADCHAETQGSKP